MQTPSVGPLLPVAPKVAALEAGPCLVWEGDLSPGRTPSFERFTTGLLALASEE